MSSSRFSHVAQAVSFAFPKVSIAFSIVKVLRLYFQIRKLETAKRKGELRNEYITAVPDKIGARTVKILGVSI